MCSEISLRNVWDENVFVVLYEWSLTTSLVLMTLYSKIAGMYRVCISKVLCVFYDSMDEANSY